MGCDEDSPAPKGAKKQFLLTHPVWDVTPPTTERAVLFDISTHTSRVGCDAERYRLLDLAEISTHTSRVGCDRMGFRQTAH